MNDDNRLTRSRVDDPCTSIPPDARTGIAAVEREARAMAAWQMGLVNDRRGERLPDDLWKQKARAACAHLNVPYDNWLIWQKAGEDEASRHG